MADENNDNRGPTKRTSPEEVTLQEIRLRYQEQEQRRTDVEAKIGTVLTVDAIIVSAVGIFSTVTFILIAAMTAALCSVIIGIYALRVQNYHIPGGNIEDYLQHIYDPPEDPEKEWVKSYISVIEGNEETDDSDVYFKGNKTKNDEKFEFLALCMTLTGVALSLVLVHSALSLV